ncbi:phosphonate metabolism transcriptional regulator PhnF [Methyloraptor flagellatus]|uniref:Phosphonate metabolism transcriptional regulator PhnF n=1 Tax=Methyloraptor flagellatus TaxID=3162530 RepID=A0AAU7XE29_9HYPH
MTEEENEAPVRRSGSRGPAAMPVWHMIRMELEHEIRSGLIGVGAKLPSEHELAERFGVNRHTVRAAFARLAEQGLVVARRGAGVFVAERPPEYAINRDTKWSEIEAAMAAEPAGRLIAEYRRKATGRIAAQLHLAEGTELIVLESVRSATARVTTYGYHAFEAARFDGIGARFAERRSFTAAITSFGIPRFFRTSTWIDCRMPRRIEAEALGVPTDQPVMVMSYVDSDATGTPILLGTAVLPSGSLTLRVDT